MCKHFVKYQTLPMQLKMHFVILFEQQIAEINRLIPTEQL